MSEWNSYLARGIPPRRAVPLHKMIYHMTERNDFENQTINGEDGFVHATGDANFLLNIGNLFYKSNIGDWICLEIDTNKLSSRVIYEPAAAVGDTKHSKFAEDEPPLFPHIYGGINPDAVVKKLNVVRSLDGSFDAIDGLVSAIGSATIS